MSALLLEDVRAFVRRYVVLDDDQAAAVTLWAAHTHIFEAFSCTPYLAISSPEKRSGKTRLLEVLELLVREPLPTANISDAALFRVIDQRAPTLLIDEVDALFGRGARDREELRGLLCAGFRDGATVHRMGGASNTTLQTFGVYCPKAFAGIGDCLPDTIIDRAIPIRLQRRTREEKIERFRLRDVEPIGHELRGRLADWLEPQRDHLAATRPALPDELDDRAQDVWEALLGVADLATDGAGDGLAVRARQAALALSSGDEREDESLTALLLRDIQTAFSAAGNRLQTGELIERLAAIEESPWGDWRGKPISPQALSKLLRPYRIRTMPVWVEGETVRGYKLEQFDDAFSRVLGVRGARNVRRESAWGKASNTPTTPNAPHASEGKNGAPTDRLEVLREALDGGHITEAEYRETRLRHFRLRRIELAIEARAA